MKDIVWIRWYKLYADGITPKDDDGYYYQWYHKGDMDLVRLGEIIEIDLDEGIDLYSESEHYRSFHWEFISIPPKSYMEEQLKYYTNLLNHTTSMIKYYRDLMVDDK